MIAFLKVTIIFVLIVSAILNKLPLVWALLGGSFILGVSFGLSFIDIIKTTVSSTIAENTIKLVLILYFIAILENILRNKELLKNMVQSLKNLIKDPRLTLISMPMIMGLLPSVGGALFSAPLLEEASSGNEISPEKKGFLNFWFRHVWEPFFPLYPGIILASTLSDIKLPIFIQETLPYGLSVFAIGLLIGFYNLPLKKEELNDINWKEELLVFLQTFWPFILLISVVLIFHIDLLFALSGLLVLLFILYKYDLNDIKRTLKESLKIENLLLIVAVMIFKGLLEKTNAVNDISQFLSSLNIPLIIIFFILPFIVGLLTGVTQASIGITFPIILSIIPYGENIKWVIFSFISGYTGVMMSPTHLCLVLTREYYQAEWNKLYKEVIKAGILLIIFTFIKALI
jgi:integral membrane protein (TIGR00529 family)